MSAEHSPVPWLLDIDGTPLVYALNEEGTNRFSASVVKGYEDQRRAIKTSTEEINANARLIAACPVMLAALEQWQAISYGGATQEQMERMRVITDAVLKQAKGVKP